MSSSFAREVSVVPTSIQDISVELYDPEPNSGGAQSAHASVQIGMSDGSVVVRRYNLVQHLDPPVIGQLIDFVAMVRAKAVSEILPEAS